MYLWTRVSLPNTTAIGSVNLGSWSSCPPFGTPAVVGVYGTLLIWKEKPAQMRLWWRGGWCVCGRLPSEKDTFPCF